MLKDFILEGSVEARDVVDYLVHVKVCGEFAFYYLEDSSALVCQVRDKHAAGWDNVYPTARMMSGLQCCGLSSGGRR